MSAAENRQASAEGAGTEAGRRLAEARQAQQQSAADIARQLKLSVAQVEALESGHYERLPGPIFVRGFIRNYARLVRLDANELLRPAEAAAAPAAPADRAPPADIPYPGRARKRWPLAIAALVVIAALAAYEMYWDEVAPGSVPGVTAVQPPAQRQAQAPAPDAGASAIPALPVGAAPDEGVKTAEPTMTQTEPAAPAPAEQAPSEAQPPAAAPRAGEKQVMLEFDDESWVEIRDRNERVIFSQLNRPGTQQRVDGLPPFSVVVGNAHAVRLTFDGRSVDLAPHTRVDVARLILR